MSSLKNVFTAHARPTPYENQLAAPKQRSAYVFGAAGALGEAVLNQLLAQGQYQWVYVDTPETLPTTVAHLKSFDGREPLALKDSNVAIDFIACLSAPEPDVVAAYSQRRQAYRAMPTGDWPALLGRCTLACTPTNSYSPAVQPSFMVISPSQSLEHLAAGMAGLQNFGNMAFARASEPSARSKAYQFQAQGASWLDRLGAWILNVCSDAAHGIMNPAAKTPLTIAKQAQRIVQRILGQRAVGSASLVLVDLDSL